MKRTIHLVVRSTLLISLFLLGCFCLDSCGKKVKETDEPENIANDLEEYTDDLTSDDELFEDDDVIDYSYDDAESGESDYDETPSNDDVKADIDYTTDRAKDYSTVSRTYMIVVGNYLVESNADEMVRNLKTSGYSDAEKVVFDLSQYYTVIASRYSDRSSADLISQKLRRDGVDNYILGRK